MTTRILLGALIVAAVCIADQSHAQDAVAVSPDIYTVLFENDEIRVLELTYEPGERDAMHSHPRYTIVAKEGGTLRIHTESSDPADVVIQVDQPLLLDPVKAHWGENVGDTTVRVIAVEFKGLASE
jgi:quercetin dioxygenase-like cupin family protein